MALKMLVHSAMAVAIGLLGSSALQNPSTTPPHPTTAQPILAKPRPTISPDDKLVLEAKASVVRCQCIYIYMCMSMCMCMYLPIYIYIYINIVSN
jgi:hypothetical protein